MTLLFALIACRGRLLIRLSILCKQEAQQHKKASVGIDCVKKIKMDVDLKCEQVNIVRLSSSDLLIYSVSHTLPFSSYCGTFPLGELIRSPLDATCRDFFYCFIFYSTNSRFTSHTESLHAQPNRHRLEIETKQN